MQDKLKNYVDDQREDFEVYNLDLETSWASTATSLKSGRPKGRKIYYISGIAASLVLLLTVAGLFLKKEKAEIVANSEWLEAEDYYQQEIDTKWLLIQSKVTDEQLLADIQMMDQAFAELKNDLRDNVDNEEVITAMMDSYRLKLKVLDRILKKIEEQRKDETDTLITL